MNAPFRFAGATVAVPLSALRALGLPALALPALGLVTGCASAGQGPAASPATDAPAAATASEGPPETAVVGAGNGAGRAGSHFVITAAEIERAPGIMTAYDAVRSLRPYFLRVRGTNTISGGRVGEVGPRGGGRGRRAAGDGRGQAGGSEMPSNGDGPGRGAETSRQPGVTEEVGIIVYLDRQRLGRVSALQDIPVAIVEEIRLLNVAEANTRFGRGHPHGVILVTMKTGALPPE